MLLPFSTVLSCFPASFNHLTNECEKRNKHTGCRPIYDETWRDGADLSYYCTQHNFPSPTTRSPSGGIDTLSYASDGPQSTGHRCRHRADDALGHSRDEAGDALFLGALGREVYQPGQARLHALVENLRFGCCVRSSHPSKIKMFAMKCTTVAKASTRYHDYSQYSSTTSNSERRWCSELKTTAALCMSVERKGREGGTRRSLKELVASSSCFFFFIIFVPFTLSFILFLHFLSLFSVYICFILICAWRCLLCLCR